MDNLASVIASDDPNNLLYFEETTFFEVREKSYATDSQDKVAKEKAIQTLVTDIASIANSGGGYIFLGLKTSLKPHQPSEYVSSICGIKHDNVHIDKWRKIVRDYTAPRLTFESINHGFIGEDKLVFWMKIPDSKATGEYPTLVTKAKWQVEQDIFLKGELYGLYHRDGAENLLESPHKIQQVLASGISKPPNKTDVITAQYQRLSEQIGSMSETIQELPKSKESIIDLAPQFSEADSKLASELGYFYIYSKPRKPMVFTRFWDDDPEDKNTVYWSMKNPKTLRPMGWDLRVAVSESPYPNGSSWEVTNGHRKILQVTDTGEVFGAVSIESVLNHGSSDYMPINSDIDGLVNELALTEYLYNYAVFTDELRRGRGAFIDYDLVYGFRVPKGIKLALLKSARIFLTSYEVDGELTGKTKWEDEYIQVVPPEEQAGREILNITRGGFGAKSSPATLIKNARGYMAVDTDYYKSIV
jgi:schlafen family protein